MESLGSFYAAEGRRDSEELRLGSNWRSPDFPDHEFLVFWLVDTQELCAMRSPVKDVASDGPVGRFILHVPPHTNPQELRDDEVTVEVLAKLSQEELDERLAGWESHQPEPDGYDWLRRAVTDN